MAREGDTMKNYPLIDKKNTGRKIRELMNRQGITVKDVQEFMNLSTPQAIYHWLGGRSLPTIDNIYALSALLQVPMDEIICGNRQTSHVQSDTGRRLKIYMDRINELVAA